MLVQTAVFLALVSVSSSCVFGRQRRAGLEWNYLKQGRDWPDLVAACGVGEDSGQSPIDINTGNSQENDELDSFVFGGAWDTFVANGDVINNGHTYQFNDNDGTRTVSGGGLTGTYTLLQFHVHFGSRPENEEDGVHGSEHTVDGYRYPGEIHFVMQNAVSFPDATTPGHYAVLGFWIQIGDYENDGFLDVFLDAIQEVKNESVKSTESMNNKINMRSIVDREGGDNFYRYAGSLTTPTCDAVVTWTVFERPLYISDEQFDSFLGGVDTNDLAIADTWRVVVPTNDRYLWRSPGTGLWTHPKPEDTGLNAATLAIILVIVIILVIALVVFLCCI